MDNLYTYYAYREISSLAEFNRLPKKESMLYIVHNDGLYLGSRKIASYAVNGGGTTVIERVEPSVNNGLLCFDDLD